MAGEGQDLVGFTVEVNVDRKRLKDMIEDVGEQFLGWQEETKLPNNPIAGYIRTVEKGDGGFPPVQHAVTVRRYIEAVVRLAMEQLEDDWDILSADTALQYAVFGQQRFS